MDIRPVFPGAAMKTAPTPTKNTVNSGYPDGEKVAAINGMVSQESREFINSALSNHHRLT